MEMRAFIAFSTYFRIMLAKVQNEQIARLEQLRCMPHSFVYLSQVS